MKNINVTWFLFIVVLQFTLSFSTSNDCTVPNYNNCSKCNDIFISKSNGKHEIKSQKYNNAAKKQNGYQLMDNVNINNEPNKKIPWYFKVPLLPVLFATSPMLPKGECRRQVKKYLEELNNGTLWAMRMFDSSTKYPEGILTGHTRHYGNFDECYQIGNTIKHNSIKQDVEVIGGKYCLVNIEYEKLNISTNRIGLHTLDFDPNGSVWEAIKEKGDFRRVKRYLLELALCVPDACNELDIEMALNEPLKQKGIEQNIIVRTGIKGKCQAQKDSPKFSMLSKIYCYIILGMFLLVAVSTWYDISIKHIKKKENEFLALDLLLCFSVPRNYKSITQITYNHPGLDSIFLFRFLLMCGVIFGHRLMQYCTNPMINSELFEYTYTLPSLMIVFNGPIIIDAFFAFGGMILAYHILYELDKKKKINFITAILIRYFRFTPSYIVIIGFIALVLPHLGSGPYWEYKIGLESSSCADNWWANILYINNYVNTDKLCMFQSWYLSVDYHLYILALFVIYLFWRLPRKYGYLFLIAIIIGGCVIPFCISYFYHVQPLFRGLPHVYEVREDSYFINHYIKTHERLPSYFVGVLGGAIIYDHSLSPWRISKPWRHIPLVFGAFLMAIKVQIMALKYFDPNNTFNPMDNAIYASLSRPAFAMTIVFIVIIMSVSDKSEFHHKLLKPQWAQPVARLTYGAYLVHNIEQIFAIGVARNARTYSIHNVIWDVVPDVIFSFLLSFILTIVVEGPFRKLEKLLVTKKSHKVA